MSKAQWKQPALKQAEKKVADREQAIQEAKFWKEQADAYKESAVECNAQYLKAKREGDEYRQKAEWYDYLRRHGVVLMGDEPKHLQGEDMDKYIDAHTWGTLGSNYSRALGRSLAQTKNGLLRQFIDANLLSSNPAGLKLRMKGRYNIGTDTGSKSEEADSQDSGHHTDILRYADRYRLR